MLQDELCAQLYTADQFLPVSAGLRNVSYSATVPMANPLADLDAHRLFLEGQTIIHVDPEPSPGNEDDDVIPALHKDLADSLGVVVEETESARCFTHEELRVQITCNNRYLENVAPDITMFDIRWGPSG